MKRMIAWSLALVMLLSLFAGCGKQKEPAAASPDASQAEASKQGDKGKTTKRTAKSSSNPELADRFEDADDVSYVLIYNPGMYDPRAEDQVMLRTGDLSDQIDVSMARADEFDQPESDQPRTLSQDELNEGYDLMNADLSDDRAGGLAPQFKVGDQRAFYGYYKGNLKAGRGLMAFTCRYSGTHAVIWTTDKTISDDLIASYGKEFDDVIYDRDVETFGFPRYADQGGKIHLLMYPLQDGLCGCFCGLDLFSSRDVSESEIVEYGINTDLAIVHVNSHMAALEKNWDMTNATLAHEFQHLICRTSMLYAGVSCDTWLNEAMSGYIEEQLYPGVKETGGDYGAFARSNLIRYGQSMYDFTTGPGDIGVYGQVYLFSEYLAMLGGKNVFLDFHDYWRSSRSKTLSEAEALAAILPEDAVESINDIAYPSSVKVGDANETFLSKLVLSFYLSLLHFDKDDPESYGNITAEALLYDTLDECEIPGGGRIIIATKDGTFQIPEDADDGLVYVGLNRDFEQVTVPICK